MLEVTKTPLTDGVVFICAKVPEALAMDVELAIREVVAPNIPADTVLQDATPGSILRGARGLREMTQKNLAALIGVHKSHISEMERGVRPIGKAMAKRLAEALSMPYKSFL